MWNSSIFWNLLILRLTAIPSIINCTFKFHWKWQQAQNGRNMTSEDSTGRICAKNIYAPPDMKPHYKNSIFISRRRQAAPLPPKRMAVFCLVWKIARFIGFYVWASHLYPRSIWNFPAPRFLIRSRTWIRTFRRHKKYIARDRQLDEDCRWMSGKYVQTTKKNHRPMSNATKIDANRDIIR